MHLVHDQNLQNLQKLVDSTPDNVLSQVLKSREHSALQQWVLDQAPASLPTLKQKIYYLLLGKPDLVCHLGRVKKFVAKQKKFGFCGNTKQCQCFRDQCSQVGKQLGVQHMMDKRVATWQEKYGVDNISQCAEIKQKRKHTMEQKNYQHLYAQLKLQKQIDGFEQVTERLHNVVEPNFDKAEYKGCFRKNFYEWKCVECGAIFSDHVDYGRVPRCVKCYPHNVSAPQRQLNQWLTQNNILFEHNTRNVISPLELDFYIADKKLAIEFNGVYWHSDQFKDKHYHVEKFLECQHKGVHLIQIWEDEWNSKQSIVLNRLSAVLGLGKKVPARKCVLVDVDKTAYKKFCSEFHLQGFAQASVVLGLEYHGQLVAVMSFGKSRYSEHEYELIRYCSDGQVVGGASRLFSNFVKKYQPTSIVSFASRTWSQGNLYRQLGFQDITSDQKNTGYWYVKNNQRFHRSTFTKKRLIELGQCADKSESDIMSEMGFLKIYDCGNSKFLWTS